MRRAGLAVAVCAGVVAGGLILANPPESSGCRSEGGLPDHACTPGVVGSKLRVCREHTAMVRPSVAYTNALKRKQLRQYDYEDKDPRHYEEDHRVPLALGGAPKDPRNLWPEPRSGALNAQVKDALELVQFKAVCDHGADLKAAQQRFTGDYWKVPTPVTDPDRDR